MKRFHRLPLLISLLGLLLAAHSRAQDSGEDAEKRVQYQLVLPDEKTPENVKPEEHNPFESTSEAQSRLAPGDTEENRVRDKLLKLPVVGVKRMTNGRMRVLLGDIILETGGKVPPVLPEQLVELTVKNITGEYIELAWQEKRATGLPPKLMIIPIQISPTVRYQMFGQSDEEGSQSRATNATMDLSLRERTTQPQQAPPAALPVTPPSALPAVALEEAPPATRAQTPGTAAAPEQASTAPAPVPEPADIPTPAAPPASPAVESMVRMLFGNPTPVPK